MEQAMHPAGAVDDVVEPPLAGISWAAVVAGAIASCALTLVLLSLGAGLGFSVVSPWSNSGVSATTFEIGTGLYFTTAQPLERRSVYRGSFPGYRAWFPGMGIGFSARRGPSRLSRHLVNWRRNLGRDAGGRLVAGNGSDGWLCRYAPAARQSNRGEHLQHRQRQ